MLNIFGSISNSPEFCWWLKKFFFDCCFNLTSFFSQKNSNDLTWIYGKLVIWMWNIKRDSKNAPENLLNTDTVERIPPGNILYLVFRPVRKLGEIVGSWKMQEENSMCFHEFFCSTQNFFKTVKFTIFWREKYGDNVFESTWASHFYDHRYLKKE